MMEPTVVDALLALRPGEEWRYAGDGTGGTSLFWMSKTTKPTDSEINAKLAELKTAYDKKKYQRDRAAEYPSVVDQLDLIYHSGVDAWKAKIKETKDKYPK